MEIGNQTCTILLGWCVLFEWAFPFAAVVSMVPYQPSQPLINPSCLPSVSYPTLLSLYLLNSSGPEVRCSTHTLIL